jgi:hypothetical protein
LIRSQKFQNVAFNDRAGASAAHETDEVAAAAAFWEIFIAFDPAKNDGKNYQQERVVACLGGS